MKARSEILAALTPRHRATFGAFVAETATSPSIRNVSANAAMLDEMLLPEEAHEIGSIASAERDAERDAMQESLRAFHATLPLLDRLNVEALEAKQRVLSPRPKPSLDPGVELLRVTVESLGSNSEQMRQH